MNPSIIEAFTHLCRTRAVPVCTRGNNTASLAAVHYSLLWVEMPNSSFTISVCSRRDHFSCSGVIGKHPNERNWPVIGWFDAHGHYSLHTNESSSVIGTPAIITLIFVASCEFDLCMLGQTGATLEERQRWIINIIIILYRSKIVLSQVEGN